MTRLKLTIQYQGTGYYGWQAQQGLPTIEGELVKAWTALTGGFESAPDFQAAGRTDGGVHAWGQVVHLDTNWPQVVTLVKVVDGMNRFLPDTIRVARAAVVDGTFHARYSGVARHYVYQLYNRRALRPDLAGRAGHEGRPLDLTTMMAALELLPLGEHDFSGFRDAECQSNTPICTLLHRSLRDAGGGVMVLEIGANHFLHHMVRNIVGTLVGVGLGKRPVTALADALAAKDRTVAGMTFSPDGLYLRQVDYKPHAEHDVAGEV